MVLLGNTSLQSPSMSRCSYHNKHLFLKVLSVLFFLSSACCGVLNGLLMKSISEGLSQDLELIKSEELGVDYVKKLYASFKHAPATIDANKTVTKIAMKLEDRITNIFTSLLQAKVAIENIQATDNATQLHSALIPCIEGETSISKMCGNLIDMILYKTHKDQLKVDYILQKLKYVVNVRDSIKQQYFISSNDVELGVQSPFADCSDRDHSLLWNNYRGRNTFAKRNVVLLLDHGGALSKHHFHIVKSVAKEMVAALSENDNVALAVISNDWAVPQLSEKCFMPNQMPSSTTDIPDFAPANGMTKKILYKFINSLTKTTGATNHTLGLEMALNIIKKSQIQNETVMILYVSRGLLSSLTQAKLVLGTILESSRNMSTPFVINTCTVIDETRPTIYETQFMNDIALQDYQKYNISVDENRVFMAGTMVAVNSTETVGFAVSHFYGMFNSNSSYDLEEQISLPMWDQVSGDLAVSFSLGSFSAANDQFGLLGIDVYFARLFEEVVYFSNSVERYRYAFLMDLQGRVLIHPSFPNTVTVKQQLQFVDVSHFEKGPDLQRRLLTERSGVHVVTKFGSSMKYTWRRISEWYVVCIVTRNSRDMNEMLLRPFQINWPLNDTDAYSIQLVYHHMDISKICRHLNQVATLDAGSLYLSASCFQSSSTQANVVDQSYMAYLQDNTRILANPGLKEQIKDEVAALAHILIYLRNQHMSSYRSKYLVRRYVTSFSGVLEMFPGSILNKGLDPTKRPWFLQAVEHKSRLVITPPYLDDGGGGYIATMAYAVGHTVVAIDVTYGYVYRMLLKRMPFCASANITCFLMDDRGYLIYHPNLIDPNGHGPVEKQHLVHKESLVANDILSHDLFIRKMLCNSYGGGTVQRYYKLNTSFSDVLVSTVQGEHCVNYHIAAVPDTNVFVAMVNATCNVVVTFCPCSIVDRLCLNCNRMEQKECECPCECPIEADKCWTGLLDNPECSWFPEHTLPTARFPDVAKNEMKPCFPNTCSLEKTQLGCLGVTGCEWCKFDVDGTSLNNPFCATLAACFNGVLGSVTPYKNSFHEFEVSNDYFNVPVSFITLFVLVVFVLLCMFYLYHRSMAVPASERLYLSSTQDNHLRMSDLNLNNTYASNSHRDKLLQDDKPDPISPYCVPSTYRRAPVAADSDHGYSTMTQHDESEHMSLAPVELDSQEDELNSDSVSVYTSGSSKPVVQQTTIEQFTCIPKRNNCIVVPVTVHRNMETT